MQISLFWSDVIRFNDIDDFFQMSINLMSASIIGKNFSWIGRQLGKIFKFLIGVLFMGHSV